MSWALVRTTPPTFEPMSVEELKALLHFDASDEDAVIMMCMVAAREYFETDTGISLVPQTWTLSLDRFPLDSVCPILLPQPPVTAITHVKYYDDNGVQQTWGASNYQADTQGRPGRLMPAYNVTWPTTRPIMNAVEVRYVAGFTAPGLIPSKYKQAVAMLTGHYLENREATAPVEIRTVPLSYEAIADSCRVWSFG